MFNYCDIIILTARRDVDNTKRDTEEWLRNKGIMYTKLIMRKRDKFQEGHIIKREELKEIKKEYRILFAVDDDPEINKMYKEEGVLCLQPNNHLYSS
jgi:thiamine monophosphate synthase